MIADKMVKYRQSFNRCLDKQGI